MCGIVCGSDGVGVSVPVAPPPSPVVCNGSELTEPVPVLVVDVLEEASQVLQELVSESLSGVLARRVLGRLEEYPASSCQALVAGGFTGSGYYWLRAGNGSSVSVYCDLSTDFAALYPRGFMRAGHLDMREPSHSCPSSLRTIFSSCDGERLCGRGQPSPGCSSVWYSTWELPFCRVCGRVLGYQFSSTNGFFASQYDPTLSLDDTYLDGVSLTHGESPRQHIWSFVAGIAESAEGYSACPCSDAGNMVAAVPSFVRDNYYCASGDHGQSLQEESLYCEHLLWDGRGCAPHNTCCQRQGNSAWFCAELDQSASSDLELRLCGNEDTGNEDTPLQIIELYIQ